MLAVSEALLIASSFAAISIARLGGSGAASRSSDPEGVFKIAGATGVFVACMYCFDLYDSRILSKRREVLIRLFEVLGSVYVLLALIQYLCPSLRLSRSFFQAGVVAVGTLLWLWRELFSLVNGVPRFAERAVILGENALVESLIHECETRPELGLRIVGRNLPADKLAAWMSRPTPARERAARFSESARSQAGAKPAKTLTPKRAGSRPAALWLSSAICASEASRGVCAWVLKPSPCVPAIAAMRGPKPPMTMGGTGSADR